jgi:hypothetical protein
VGVSILPDEKYTLCFTIANTLLEPQMSIRIQDDGTKFPADGSYLDCNITNNIGTASSLLTVRDYIITTPVATTFNVLDNDYFGTCGRGALTAFDTIANSGLKHGTLTINADSSFTYTPANPSFLGVDSLMYYIKCGADSSAAKVYILIQNPSLTIKYVACAGASVTMGFAPATGVQYYWYNAATGGSIVANGNSANTLTIIKDNTPVQTWWVEPRSGNVIFPRNRVDLELSEDCGVANPSGCAVNGTILFKEDFGGNSDTDPMYKPEGIDEMSSIYKYNITTISPACCPYLDEKEYMITKKGEPHGSAWVTINDHTHPDTDQRGYFLEVNSSNEAGQFYEHQIDGLCEGLTLYFSAWINNVLKTPNSFPHHVNQVFILEDLSGERIIEYYTGDIDNNGNLGWRQYGFKFTVPENMSSVILKIINNGQGSSGNDFGLDDIEIRLCTPSVDLGIKDTVVCAGSKLNIHGTYIKDCTFGDELAYRLEFRHIDSLNWETLSSGTEPVEDCNAAASLDALTTGWDISSLSSANEGYYRVFISSPEHINKVNCRAVSDSVYVKVVGTGKAADIRVQVCPLPDRPIRLSTFLDSLSYNTVSWSAASLGVPAILNPQTGEISSSAVTSTHKYVYNQTSKCGTSSAIAYVHFLKTQKMSYKDTIVICKDEQRSRNIQINSIIGLDFGGGTWTYDVPVLGSYMKVFPTSSSYYGALVFDAYQAWFDDATDSYIFPYRGDTEAKKFVFSYSASNTCVGNITKEIVIVVTDQAF